MDEDTTIEQELEEIVNKLKTERAALQDRMQRDQLRINRLNFAIEGLERQAPEPPTPAAKGPSVYDMAVVTVEQMHNGTVFDAQSLREKMTGLYPAEAHRIKVGVYNAIATLHKKNKIERTPGGFRAVRPVTQPA